MSSSRFSEAVPLNPMPASPVPASPPRRPAAVPSFQSWRIPTARIRVSRCLMGGLALLCLFTDSRWAGRHPLAEALLVTAGLLLTGVAAAGRLWCSLHIAGHKDRRLVCAGPYSVCRHPLYFFSLLGAAGAAAATGTILIPLMITGIFLTAYRPVMAAEEMRLHRLFGAEQEAYQRRVPRFFPDWRLLVHAPSWNSDPAVFFRHSTGVIWFPAAAGLLMLLPALRAALDLPVLMRLP